MERETPPGQFDDLPAINFGNIPPLPDGYVVVWCEGMETYYGTKRGTDLELGGSWDRYWVRKCCLLHAKENGDEK